MAETEWDKIAASFLTLQFADIRHEHKKSRISEISSLVRTQFTEIGSCQYISCLLGPSPGVIKADYFVCGRIFSRLLVGFLINGGFQSSSLAGPLSLTLFSISIPQKGVLIVFIKFASE